VTTSPTLDQVRRAGADDVAVLAARLVEGFPGQPFETPAFGNQFLLDALDRGEAPRFLVWPRDDPAAVCYLGDTGTVVPAGDPRAGPAFAAALEERAWRVLVGEAPIGQRIVTATTQGLFRRRARAREQRFMVQERAHGEARLDGFRLARSDDIEALTTFACALHVEDEMGPPVGRSGRAAIRARMRDSVVAGATWVVDRGAGPVAKVDVSLRSVRRGAQIAGVYVDPAWRGQGIGGEAVRAVAAALRAEGMPGVTLHVRAKNPPALRAYRRAGFVDRGEWILALR
jgi:uncharacterized protein